jgi:Helix-turn-helix domain
MFLLRPTGSDQGCGPLGEAPGSGAPRMSVRVMADVWENGPADPIDRSVLLRLANFCDDAGGNCFPSIANTAAAVCRSERTVIRSIARLEEEGWLAVERGSGRPQKDDPRKNRSQYKINVDRLKGCQPDTVSTEKGVSHDSKKVTTATRKGDSHDKPPHPHKGVSVIDPSKDPSEVNSLKDGLTAEDVDYYRERRREGKPIHENMAAYLDRLDSGLRPRESVQ